MTAGDGCGAPAGGVSVTAAAGALGTQTVVEGRVTREGTPVSTGYARPTATCHPWPCAIAASSSRNFPSESNSSSGQ